VFFDRGDYILRQKLNQFLNRTTNYDHVIAACFATFLVTTIVTVAVAITIVGGWGNLKYLTKFTEVLAIVEHTYIGDADADTVTDAGFRAIIAALEDRWSYYMTAEEYEAYQDHNANVYTGIGITLQSTEDGRLEILEVSEDSPAMTAGLTAGMYLTHLNGESLEGKSVSDVGAEIRIMEGEFTLTAVDGAGHAADYTLSLAKIYSSPVEYEMLEGEIGYIKLKNFDENCNDEAEKALDDLLSRGAQGLIFDVRNNGGGYVSELTKLLDRLLPEGEIFISVDGKGNEKITTSDANCVDLPMVVLVNGNSYSAAEYFAAVLHEYGVATTVGEATTGKGRSQITIPLVDGSAVHVSSRRYLTPSRIDLSEQGGIVPDIALELGETDTQLDAAKEFLLTQS